MRWRKIGGAVMLLGALLILNSLINGFIFYFLNVVPFLIMISGAVYEFTRRTQMNQRKYVGGSGAILQPIIVSRQMICQNCGAENPLKSKVCRECGVKLYEDMPGRRCPVCLAPLKLANILGPGHIMCNICFSEFQVKSGISVSSSATSHLDKGGISRRTVIAVSGIAVFIFLVLMGFSASLQRQPTSQTTTIIERGAGELFPTREELPTEWKISSRSNISLNATGFLEGVEFVIVKQDIVGGAGARIKIYKFNTPIIADEYYVAKITQLRAEGGYKEISTTMLNVKSYGTFIGTITGEISRVYFVKYNIYCEIQVAGSYYYYTSDDALYLARLVLQKI